MVAAMAEDLGTAVVARVVARAVAAMAERIAQGDQGWKY